MWDVIDKGNGFFLLVEDNFTFDRLDILKHICDSVQFKIVDYTIKGKSVEFGFLESYTDFIPTNMDKFIYDILYDLKSDYNELVDEKDEVNFELKILCYKQR